MDGDAVIEVDHGGALGIEGCSPSCAGDTVESGVPSFLPSSPGTSFEPWIGPISCPLIGQQFDAVVNSASVDTKPTSFETKQPWERGLTKFLFGKNSTLPSMPEVQFHPQPVHDLSGQDTASLKCVKKLADVQFIEASRSEQFF